MFVGGGKLDGCERDIPDDEPPPFYVVPRLSRLMPILSERESDVTTARQDMVFRRGLMDDNGLWKYHEVRDPAERGGTGDE